MNAVVMKVLLAAAKAQVESIDEYARRARQNAQLYKNGIKDEVPPDPDAFRESREVLEQYIASRGKMRMTATAMIILGQAIEAYPFYCSQKLLEIGTDRSIDQAEADRQSTVLREHLKLLS